MYIDMLFGLAAALAVILAYRQGVKDGQSVKAEKPPAPMFTLPHSPKAASEEELRESQVWDNIFNYDGTAESQKEVM